MRLDWYSEAWVMEPRPIVAAAGIVSLPWANYKGRDADVFLRFYGFERISQQGSHIKYRHPDTGVSATLAVPKGMNDDLGRTFGLTLNDTNLSRQWKFYIQNDKTLWKLKKKFYALQEEGKIPRGVRFMPPNDRDEMIELRDMLQQVESGKVAEPSARKEDVTKNSLALEAIQNLVSGEPYDEATAAMLSDEYGIPIEEIRAAWEEVAAPASPASAAAPAPAAPAAS